MACARDFYFSIGYIIIICIVYCEYIIYIYDVFMRTECIIPDVGHERVKNLNLSQF